MHELSNFKLNLLISTWGVKWNIWWPREKCKYIVDIVAHVWDNSSEHLPVSSSIRRYSTMYTDIEGTQLEHLL